MVAGTRQAEMAVSACRKVRCLMRDGEIAVNPPRSIDACKAPLPDMASIAAAT
jgi:hypothetical protein